MPVGEHSIPPLVNVLSRNATARDGLDVNEPRSPACPPHQAGEDHAGRPQGQDAAIAAGEANTPAAPPVLLCSADRHSRPTAHGRCGRRRLSVTGTSAREQRAAARVARGRG
eukprot:365359-Chlamydomonas_euryale.AAC.2